MFQKGFQDNDTMEFVQNVQNFFRVYLQSLLIFPFARWKEMIYLQRYMIDM